MQNRKTKSKLGNLTGHERFAFVFIVQRFFQISGSIMVTYVVLFCRRSSIRKLIEVMYKSLVDNLDGAEPPYSLEKVVH